MTGASPDPQIQHLIGALAVRPGTPSARAAPAALRIAGVYAFLAALYIALSDQLVAWLAPDAATLTLLQTYKGLLFVLASGLIIGALVYREVQGREEGNQRVQAAARQLHQLIENSQDLIALLDGEGRILFVSAAAERLLGYAPEEMIGQLTTAFLHPADEERRERWTGSTALPSRRVPPTEARFRHKDGSWRWLRITGGTMDEGLDRPRLVLNATDVTDEKRAARERENLETQLRQSQKMDAIGRLAGGVAHDFNNLLTVISGNVEMIREHEGPDAEWAEELADVARAAGAAAELTRHLLAFSRQQVLRPRVLDANRVVRETTPLLRRVLGPDVELSLRLGEELGRVEVDPIHLEQVLLNLVLNARDAMPDGGHITLATSERLVEPGYTSRTGQPVWPGHYVAITVADTGTGMTSEVAERIFEPFFTTKEVGKGTGLGLSTVLGIVQQSGGFVELETAPGAGARFGVLLPRRRRDPVREEARGREKAGAGPRRDGVVLLVEDEAGVRALVKRLLEQDGFTVMEAASGPAALDLLRQADGGRLDLLLTDMVMPEMTGDVLARTVRQDRPRLPVLFMSGYTPEATLGDELDQADMAFLAKPFTPTQLTERVRKLLE